MSDDKLAVEVLVDIASQDECGETWPPGSPHEALCLKCTLPKDHAGDEHVAHGTDGRVVGRWPRVAP